MASRLPNPVPLPKRRDFGSNVTILAATSLTLTSTLTADYVIVLLWNFVLFLLDTITYILYCVLYIFSETSSKAKSSNSSTFLCLTTLNICPLQIGGTLVWSTLYSFYEKNLIIVEPPNYVTTATPTFTVNPLPFVNNSEYCVISHFFEIFILYCIG